MQVSCKDVSGVDRKRRRNGFVCIQSQALGGSSLTNVICDLQFEILVESVRISWVETTDGRTTGSFTQLQENWVHNQQEKCR